MLASIQYDLSIRGVWLRKFDEFEKKERSDGLLNCSGVARIPKNTAVAGATGREFTLRRDAAECGATPIWNVLPIRQVAEA